MKNYYVVTLFILIICLNECNEIKEDNYLIDFHKGYIEKIISYELSNYSVYDCYKYYLDKFANKGWQMKILFFTKDKGMSIQLEEYKHKNHAFIDILNKNNRITVEVRLVENIYEK